MSASKYQLSYLVILDKTPLVCCCCWQYCFWSNNNLQHRGKLLEEVEEQELCQSGGEGGGTAFRSSLLSPSPSSLSSSLLSSPSSFHLHCLRLFHAIWASWERLSKDKEQRFSDIVPKPISVTFSQAREDSQNETLHSPIRYYHLMHYPQQVGCRSRGFIAWRASIVEVLQPSKQQQLQPATAGLKQKQQPAAGIKCGGGSHLAQ